MSDTNADADSTKSSPIELPSPLKSQSPQDPGAISATSATSAAPTTEMLAQEAAASYFDKKRRLCPSPTSNSNTPLLESKKRRKQATPIRVSNLFEFEAKDLTDITDQVSNGERREQGEKIEQKEPQSPEQERGLMPRDREDWFPSFPFSLFPDGSQFLHKSQFLSKNGFLPFLPGLPSSPPVRIFNPEAYCNLCHKEFCNKYFLKTHKANKHGIYESSPDPQAFSAAIRPVKPELLDTPNHFSTKLPAPSDEAAATSPTGDRSPELACSVCPRRFPKAFFLRKHTLEEHGSLSPRDEEQQTAPPPPPPPLPAAIPSAESAEQRQASFPRKLSPESSRMARSAGFAPDYLKKLGILDPEAFCEICCKEYCNKYFLRTHKLKRHGILLSDETGTKEENTRSGPQSQTSPLNLIMEARLKQEPPTASENDTFGESELASNQSESPVSSNSQDLCKDLQKLQTMILQLNNLQNKEVGIIVKDNRSKDDSNGFAMHVSLPGLQQEREENCGNLELSRENKDDGDSFPDFKRADMYMQNFENFRKTPDKQQLNATTPVVTPTLSQKNFNIMNSFCEICNKQLCNKYFMKTHMEKMHGIQINNEFKIGGVICDICQKELCSKYFLKVHKQNTHGIFEDGISGSGLNQSPSLYPGNLGLPPPPQFTPPEQIAQYQTSVSVLTETPEPGKHQNSDRTTDALTSHDSDSCPDMCPLCGQRFRGVKWLRSHLINEHGTELRDADTLQTLQTLQTSVATNIFDSGPSKTYRCNFCDFSSPILALLFVHERSHVSTGAPAAPSAPATPATPTSASAASATSAASEQNNADVKRFLRDIARKHNLVSSYALPESRGADTRYEMQPFVLEQFPVDSEDPERAILPAVIYLPVAEKIQSKLSVTFSLTPI